jgi:putative molybdopterin biosynthesis protein
LQLARALDVRVEEIFVLPETPASPEFRTERVTVLPGVGALRTGQPVQLCRVDRRIMASAPAAIPWYFSASDGVVTARPAGRAQTKVRVFDDEEDFGDRLLVAGCDPAISILARHVRAAGIELVLAHRNSSQALKLLLEGRIHIAGTHLRDEQSGESNVAEVARLFPRHAAAVISFAVWEEGIVTAAGNPKHIRGIEDLARADVSIVNREAGAASRILLDSLLQRQGIKPGKVRGYESEAPGHLPAAWRVESGAADCCIATGAAARAFGLGFIPLVSERYDLAIRRQHLGMPSVQTLLDALSRSGFRRELEGLGGYDARDAGRRML